MTEETMTGAPAPAIQPQAPVATNHKTTPDEYLWGANTRGAIQVRGACLAVLTNTPVALIEGPRCFFTRTERPDVLDGLAPTAKVIGRIDPGEAARFLMEREEEAKREEAKQAAPEPMPADEDTMLARPPVTVPVSEPEADALVPLDGDTTDATLV